MKRTPFFKGIMIPWFKKQAISHKIEPLRRGGVAYLPIPAGVDETALEQLSRPRDVAAGDRLWESPDEMPFYATVTGRVLGAETVETATGDRLCLAVRFGGKSWSMPEPEELPDLPEDIIEAARLAAIVDEIDGVPLWKKLLAMKEDPAPVLVINGVEPEPYACSAHGVLKLDGPFVLKGARMAAEAVGIPRCVLSVQLKRKQQDALERRLKKENVYGVPNHYPVRQYVKEGPDARVAMVGVQACLALYRAVTYGTPALTGVVTVTGEAVQRQRNLRVPYGAVIRSLFDHTDLDDDPRYVIAGDALTGTAVSTDEVPVLPGVTCVLGLIDRPSPTPRACIGCSRCTRACHKHLLPYEIARRLENTNYDRLAGLHPERCDGCGNCGYVCPVGKDLTAQVLEAKEHSASVVMKWGESDDL